MTRLALLSVSDKTGLIEFARQLVEKFDFEIVSSGGTAQALKAEGIPVMKVAEYTGAPEILGGRVKTLHPKIHGGILARRDMPEHLADLEQHQIRPIDLVVVNLYPFAATISKPGVSLADAIEQIDIGGPAMLRAAAKNFAHLTVLSNPDRYDDYLAELTKNNNGAISIAKCELCSIEFRQARALETFQHTAAYDTAIAAYLAAQVGETTNYQISAQPLQSLRYGENPHQPAAWYQTGAQPTGWTTAKILQGKELSYNNLVDLEAARRIIAEFGDTPAATIIKHNNPCGTALGDTLLAAYDRAYNADSTSAFGGIVAVNRPLDADTARSMSQTFLECIVAPACTPEAAEVFAAKKNLRVLTLADLATGTKDNVKVIAGGLLVQTADEAIETTDNWQVATTKQPTPAELQELLFAWKVCKHVKSNAIVVTKNRVTIGVGAGQMNRVGSAQIALAQAGTAAQGAILASDGFFPFDDSVKTAAAAGITAIVQPGGSMRDNDSISAANELGIVMVFTGVRHFLH
jgi:phosphoribosylaminoimidazolecarboxamide formyltransferase / IMP cyclohydrolase